MQGCWILKSLLVSPCHAAGCTLTPFVTFAKCTFWSRLPWDLGRQLQLQTAWKPERRLKLHRARARILLSYPLSLFRGIHSLFHSFWDSGLLSNRVPDRGRSATSDRERVGNVGRNWYLNKVESTGRKMANAGRWWHLLRYLVFIQSLHRIRHLGNRLIIT